MSHGPCSLVIVTLLCAAAGGCDHRPEDFSRVEAKARALGNTWGARISDLEMRRAGQFERAGKLPADSPGLADVLSRIAALEVEIAAVRAKLGAVEQAASARVQEKRGRLADETLTAGDRDLGAEIAAITTRLDEVGARIDGLEQEHADRTAAADAVKPPPHLDDPEFARGTHGADVPGIAFKGGQLDLAVATTETALERIRVLAERCDEIRLGLTGHTARPGDAKVNQQLSEGRAHQVRKHLIQKGVAAAKFAQIEGAGGARPMLPEPEPGSAEEGAMRPQELARIRKVNERISVYVLTPCR